MATSSLRLQERERQKALFEQLVSKWSGSVTDSEKRRYVALCEQRLRFHSFLDVGSENVENQWQAMTGLFRMESRARDHARLNHLKARFFQIPLESNVREIHYSVLQFLLCLIGDLKNQPNAHSESEMDTDTTPEQQELIETSDSESVYSFGESSLSDWTEESSQPSIEAVHEENENEMADIPDWAAYFRPTVQSKSVSSTEVHLGGSLLDCLSKTMLSETPLGACALTIQSEADLVVGCLRVLQGRASNVFVWNRQERHFRIHRDIQTSHFSAIAMRSLMMQFARFGSFSRILMDWVTELVDVQGNQDFVGRFVRSCPRRSTICPTLSATAQAIYKCFNDALKPIVDVESQLDRYDTTLTLIHVKALVLPIMRKLDILYRLHEKVFSLSNREGLQSALTCEILDFLYNALVESDSIGSSFYQNGSEMIWMIFTESLAPILSQLTSWLYLGDISSLSEDFFISSNPAKDSEDTDVWLDAFPIDMTVCPSFLKNVATILHDGGKALQLIRSQEYGNAFKDFGKSSPQMGRLETLINNEWMQNRLNELFSKRLQTVFESEEFLLPTRHSIQNPTRSVEGLSNISDKMALAGAFDGENVVTLMKEKELPWTFISEDVFPSKQFPGKVNPKKETEKSIQTPTCIQDVEMEDRFALPESYVRVLEAMERMESMIQTQRHPKQTNSVLVQVLPNATERRSYAQLKAMLFERERKTRPKDVLKRSKSNSAHRRPCCPTEIVLKESLCKILRERSIEVVRSFIDGLLTELGLMDNILMLKNVFLLASPAMSEWIRRFSEHLVKGKGIEDLAEFQILLEMQECFQTCQIGESLPTCGDNEFEELFFDMRAAEWGSKFPHQMLWKERSPKEVDHCALIFPLKWPLSLIINEPRLKRYNSAFLFVLKLRWTRNAIQDLQDVLKTMANKMDNAFLIPFRNLQNWRRLYRTVHEMMHFVTCLHQYVLENAYSVFDQFCKGIVHTESVSELLSQHDFMLDAIMRFSFQSRKKQWKTLNARLQFLTHSILNFCAIWKTLSNTDFGETSKVAELLESLDHVIELFNETRSSAMMILQLYCSAMGSHQELNHLTTLLNFNYIY